MAYTCVKVSFEIGHEASIRAKLTPEGFTHDWEVFVRGADNTEIHHFVEKVVFHLHETFAHPKRVKKEPPYVVKESGYAGFTLPIDIYFKTTDEPKRVRFNYDLHLQRSGPPISKVIKEKYVFQNPAEDLRRKLIKGGGVGVGSDAGGHVLPVEKSVTASGDEASQKQSVPPLVGKPKLGGDSGKKHKAKEHKPESVFADLFGTPIKTAKVSPDSKKPSTHSPKVPSAPKASKPVEKSSDKQSNSSKTSKHSSQKDSRESSDRANNISNSGSHNLNSSKEEKRDKNKEREKSREKDKSSKRSSSPSKQNNSTPPKPHATPPKRPSSPPKHTNVPPPKCPTTPPKRSSSPISSKPLTPKPKEDSKKIAADDSKEKNSETKSLESSKNGKSEKKKKDKRSKDERSKKDKHKENEKSSDKAAKLEKPDPELLKERDVPKKIEKELPKEVDKPKDREKDKKHGDGEKEKPKHKHKKKEKSSSKDREKEKIKEKERSSKKSSKNKGSESKERDKPPDVNDIKKRPLSPSPVPCIESPPSKCLPSADKVSGKGILDSMIEELGSDSDMLMSGDELDIPKKSVKPGTPPVDNKIIVSSPPRETELPCKINNKVEPVRTKTESSVPEKNNVKANSNSSNSSNSVSVKSKEKNSSRKSKEKKEGNSVNDSVVASEKVSKDSKEEKDGNKKRKRKSSVKGVEDGTGRSNGDSSVKIPKLEPKEELADEESETTSVAQQADPEPDTRQVVTAHLTAEYVSQLRELQHKIMTLEDNAELQRVVQVIAETGQYEITNMTFDFDLCALDRNTVRRLQEFFTAS